MNAVSQLNRSSIRIGWAAILLSAPACSKPPDPAETLKSVSSWLATASMAGDAWVVHSTPNPFTRNTLRRARLSVSDEQKILFTEAVPPVDTAALRASLDRAKNTLATMETLIDSKEVLQFPAALALLKSDAQRVKQMSDSINPGQ